MNEQKNIGEQTQHVSMTAETRFKSGITWKSVLAVIYSVVVFTPAVIYLDLVTLGVGIGSAVQYCTLLFFSEYSRLFGKRINKQEGAIIFGSSWVGAGPFLGLIYRAYFQQSPLVKQFGIPLDALPQWWVPPYGINAFELRTFMHPAWLFPIVVMITYFFINWLGGVFFGLILREIYIESEDLPFPLQQIPVTSVTTIVEREKNRMSVFVISVIPGIIYGTLLYAIPAYTQAIGKPISFLPVPWADFSPDFGRLLNGGGFGVGTDLGLIGAGLILPTNVVIAMFIGSFARFLIINPLLVHLNISLWADRWAPGMDFTRILQDSTLYYWLSPLIGVGFAVGLVPIFLRYKYFIPSIRSALKLRGTEIRERKAGPPVPPWFFILCFVVGVLGAVVMDVILVPGFPLWVLILYEVVLPFITGLTFGRMVGITGQSAGLPYINQLTIVMSGYKGIDVWFLPLSLNPGHDVLAAFKIAQLCEMNVMSTIKIVLVQYPLSMLFGFIYTFLFWTLAPIPSSAYPAPAIQWPIGIMQHLVWITRPAEFFDASQILYWFAGFASLTVVFEFFRLPIPIVGVAAGLGAALPVQITIIIGLLCRIVLGRVTGKEWIKEYRAIISAGLVMGEGLAIILGVSSALIVTGVFSRAY